MFGRFTRFGSGTLTSVRELLRPNMWGQISFCRKNVFTMVFVVDPAVDDDLSVLSYMAQLLQNGAPIRFGMVLAPGASPGNSADDEAVAVGRGFMGWS